MKPTTKSSDLAWSRRLAGQLRGETRVVFAERIAERLLVLCDAVASEEPEQTLLPGAIEQLCDLLRAYPDLSYPSITVTPDGELYVRWQDADGVVALAVVLPANANYLRYVLLHRGEQTVSGSAMIAVLPQVIGDHHWQRLLASSNEMPSAGHYRG